MYRKLLQTDFFHIEPSPHPPTEFTLDNSRDIVEFFKETRDVIWTVASNHELHPLFLELLILKNATEFFTRELDANYEEWDYMRLIQLSVRVHSGKFRKHLDLLFRVLEAWPQSIDIIHAMLIAWWPHRKDIWRRFDAIVSSDGYTPKSICGWHVDNYITLDGHHAGIMITKQAPANCICRYKK